MQIEAVFISPLLLSYINQSCSLTIKIIGGRGYRCDDGPCMSLAEAGSSGKPRALGGSAASGAGAGMCVCPVAPSVPRPRWPPRPKRHPSPSQFSGHTAPFAPGEGKGPLVSPLASSNTENDFLARCVVI